MKNKTLFAASLALMMAMPMQAQKFEDNFEDKTLRLDYIVAGDSVNQAIYFEQAYSNPTWAGRKTRLDEKFLNGNGQVTVYEHDTNKVLYVNTFSTLFQEWQLTQERSICRNHREQFPRAFSKEAGGCKHHPERYASESDSRTSPYHQSTGYPHPTIGREWYPLPLYRAERRCCRLC